MNHVIVFLALASKDVMSTTFLKILKNFLLLSADKYLDGLPSFKLVCFERVH